MEIWKSETRFSTKKPAAMGETLENNDLSVDYINVEEAKKSNNGVKSHKCNQCEFAFSDSSNFRRHLKRHNGG